MGNDNVRDLLRLAWKRFAIVTAIVGDLQGRAIATAFYYTILAPFGLIASRAVRDPLDRRSAPGWVVREPVDNRLESAKRQG
jgi:hypothetical protein